MNPPIINFRALGVHFQRLKARLTGRKLEPPVVLRAVNGAVKKSPKPNPPGFENLVDLDFLADYAGVHPSTIRRWLKDEKIPVPVKRYRRKLYWTYDDAWIIRIQNLPGDYHAEIDEPAERDSAGSDSTTN